MNLRKLVCFLFFIPLLFSSCEKGELPVPVHDPGNVTTSTVNMESTYKYQLFYDLKTNTIVGKNLKTLWDLGFDADENGYRIVLNSAKVMYASNTNKTDFSAVVDTIGFGLNKKWDEPSGNLDSTAIGDWRNKNNVYIIDRGYNEIGIHQGFRKIQFQMVDMSKYLIRFSQLNGTEDITLQIFKDSSYNFQFLSFATNNVVHIEPPKATWDICFTQYTHVFYNPITTYLVTGCLLNRNNTFAIMDSTVAFSEIEYGTLNKYSLSSAINTIGYNWKLYMGSLYVTNTNMNYIIKDNEGFYYKLHFIDFYNQSGIKGNPKWEFQQL